MTGQPCYVGVDVGLTATKAAAFDASGHEVAVVAHRTPRTIHTGREHSVDMQLLAAGVLRSLADLVDAVDAIDGQVYTFVGLGVTGHGNGLYSVDESLRPVGAAIPSSDSRAHRIVAELSADDSHELNTRTGSIPWAAQPAALLRWLHDNEPSVYGRIRWVLSCKDWVTTQLTGTLSADYSDASAFGMVNLRTREYSNAALTAFGLDSADVRKFPPMSGSGDVVGSISDSVAAQTGLPAGLPVVAGSMDCVAATLGAGGSEPGDVTVIVGTWAINAVVVPADRPAPNVTLSALLPNPAHMLSMEVAPTSAANLDWLTWALASSGSADPISASVLIDEAATVAPGADGSLFLPFVNGAPEHPAASGTFLGLSAVHKRPHLTRAVLEGVAQYHRTQLNRVWETGVANPTRPIKLAGGGARSPVWAQIFADILGRPLQRQQATELGARGVAALVAGAVGQADSWPSEADPSMFVEPGVDRDFYAAHGQAFDECLDRLGPIWEVVDKAALAR